MVPFICIVCNEEFLRDSDLGWVDPENDRDCICSECWIDVQNTLETDAQLGAIRKYLGQSKEERGN